MILYFIEAIYFCKLAGVSGCWHIRLICKYQNYCIFEFVVHQHCQKLGLGCLYLRVIGTVDDKNDSMRVCVICIPGSAEILLTSEVPHLQLQILMLHFFNITTDGRFCDNNLVECQLVQDSGLPRVIHSNDDYFKLHIASTYPTQPIP